MKSRIIYILIVLAVSSCKPTEILQEGKTKFYNDQVLKKVAVIAFPGQLMDIRVFEDEVSNRLRSRNTEVLAGYKIFEGQETIPADALAIRKEFKAKGFDGVIEIKLVSIRNEESNSENDYVTNREYRMMDATNYGKLVQEYGKREEKGAVFEDVKVKMDFRVVDLMQEEPQVIWAARTESSNPGNAKKVAQGMTSKVMHSLKKEAIFTK